MKVNFAQINGGTGNIGDGIPSFIVVRFDRSHGNRYNLVTLKIHVRNYKTTPVIDSEKNVRPSWHRFVSRAMSYKHVKKQNVSNDDYARSNTPTAR